MRADVDARGPEGNRKMPRVTVLTATRDRAHLLPETIRSVLAQTFSDFEYVIFDDGSTDDTSRVLQTFADSDARIRFVTSLHVGSLGALDFLFGAAKCEYVAWLSDDDLWDPAFLERAVRVLDESPDAVVAFADYERLVNGERVPAPEPRRCGLSAEHLAYGCFISLCLALIRRSVLAQARRERGFYSDPVGGSACGDWTLFLNLYPLGRFVHICEPLGALRMHSGQDSVRTSVFELARRRFAVRRKYARVTLRQGLREALEIIAWGSYHRVKRRLGGKAP